MSTELDPRVTELLDWQFITGHPLPLPIATIIDFEDTGCVVDLDGNGTIYSEQAWLDHLVAMADEVTPRAQPGTQARTGPAATEAGAPADQVTCRAQRVRAPTL